VLPSLLDLARKKFDSRTLTDAEVKLFQQTEIGREASSHTGVKEQDYRAKGGGWLSNRVVNAECLKWLCTDRKAGRLVTHKGINMCGMRVEGVLDLDDARIPFPVRVKDCVFTDNIQLERARLPSLALINCSVRNIKAAGIHIEGEAELNDGFRARGEVNFVGATIGGALDFQKAKLHNPGGITLYANRAKIGASLYLRKGFTSRGEINLTRATIGSNLDCGRSRLINPGHEAMNATSTEIFGNILLRNARTAGVINLKATNVHGFIACEGARLNDLRDRTGCQRSEEGSKFIGKALIAVSARFGGDCLLNDKFRAQGAVEFNKAKIEGNLECTKAELRTGDGAILNLEQASSLTFRDDVNSWPAEGKLLLDGFSYGRIYAEPIPDNSLDRLDWLRLQPKETFLPQPYEQLASVLKTMGHGNQARKVMIAKNKRNASFIRSQFKKKEGRPFHRFGRLFKQEWWWYNSLGKLIGYGYKPWRAFGLSLIVIVIGVLVFHNGYKYKIISPTRENAYQKQAETPVGNARKILSTEYPRFNSLAYSVESFIPLLKLDQCSNWVPSGENKTSCSLFGVGLGKASDLLRGYLCVHIITGWILTSLWVGALTGLVKT
jgi:hypothetical protein